MVYLVDLVNVGTAFLCGGAKGFCDENNIDLDNLTYVLPVVGIFTLPTLHKMLEGKNSSYFPNIILGAGLTGIGYVLGRTGAKIINSI